MPTILLPTVKYLQSTSHWIPLACKGASPSLPTTTTKHSVTAAGENFSVILQVMLQGRIVT